MKVAIVAPPWIAVPPPAYGGIESVVALLSDELARRGHDVTLFAAPGSRSRATVRELLPRTHPQEIQRSLFEADHVARAFEEIDAAARDGDPFDVVHDHVGFTSFAMADRIRTPMVQTLHGPFVAETCEFYRHHWPKACAVAISRAQADDAPGELRIAGVVGNPIAVGDWPFEDDKDDYVLWAGRMDPVKGAHRAIAAARAANVPLVLAGPVQPGQESYFADQVVPHLDDAAIRYVGEVGGREKAGLFARAQALLMPIRWREPFGMVMVEAMACGTPVVAFAEGSAPEVVRDGECGYVVDDEPGMAAALGRLDRIDPAACRRSVTDRFDAGRVAGRYAAVYDRVANRRPRAVA